MPERKKKGGLVQAALALIVLYAAITLLPAAVYGASRLQDKEKKPEESSAVSSSLPESGASETAAPPTSSQAESSAPSSAASSALPGFLEGLSVPGESQPEAESAGSFTLSDAATGETLTLTAEEFLPAALACEMDLSAPTEALKAQAVAIYTLYSQKRDAGEELACNSENWQVYVTEAAMRERWGEDFEDNYALLREVTDSVKGQLVTKDGKPICAAYFAISSGSTEAAANVWEADYSYLQAVASPGDRFADGYLSTASFTPEEFREAAAAYFGDGGPDLSGPEEGWLTDLEYTPSGTVKTGTLGGKSVSGTDLRAVFSLRSACFSCQWQDGAFVFTVKGWGHSVGMSQAGAVFLAKRGAGYEEILAHYYPGTTLTAPG